ncbi:hypothetical protein K438DRAFT_1778503 [Mycena galopus ATCC 62051]|nr:hypothetical protein K438DRAFT_1778503 [Mycena galopus ATCC 62051]
MSTNDSEHEPLPRPDELTIGEKYKALEKNYSGLVRNHGELHGRFVDLAADIKEVAAEYNTTFEAYDRIIKEHEGLTVEHEKLKVKYNKLLTLSSGPVRALLRLSTDSHIRRHGHNHPYAATSSPSVINPPPSGTVTLSSTLVWPIWTTLVSDTPEQRRQSVMDKPCTFDPARWLK